jgi:putative ABC transport system permease protein
LIYALLALGVFLTFRILNFADLTVDATFTTGAGTCAILIFNGFNPWLAVAAGTAAGALGGGITAFLHLACKIDPLLASILTMLGLYSVNLRIMGRANVSLLGATNVFSPLEDRRLMGSVTSVVALAIFVLIFKFLMDWFLSVDFGLAVMATGDNPAMAASFGVSAARTKTVGLMVANGLTGLCGALMAQYQGFADISGGTGLILVGLASVILGNAVLGTRFMFLMTLGVVVGSVGYRLVIYYALLTPWVKAQDLKIISAVIVVIALVISQSKVLRETMGQTRAQARRLAGRFVRRFVVAQRLRDLVTRISWTKKSGGLPEPMAAVPNPFSPFANVDAHSLAPLAGVDEDDEVGASDAADETSSSDHATVGTGDAPEAASGETTASGAVN